MPEPDELTLAIAQRLEIDGQYLEHVEPWDTDRIAEVRSAGRKAGRLLGWKIITAQSEPTGENRVVVAVILREWPDEDTRQRLTERGTLLMNEAISKIMPPGAPPGASPAAG